MIIMSILQLKEETLLYHPKQKFLLLSCRMQIAEYPTAQSRVFSVLFIMGRFYLDIFFNCHLLYGIELANPNP